MSLRKPLVRFDTQSRAHLVPDTVTKSSMPGAVRRRRRSRGTLTGKTKRTKGGRGKPRVVKGRVNVRVAGYLGVQKLAPSKLIPYLPANKLTQAAKKALVASGTRPSRGRGRRTKVRRRGRKGRKRRTRRKRRTGRKHRTRRKRS